MMLLHTIRCKQQLLSIFVWRMIWSSLFFVILSHSNGRTNAFSISNNPQPSSNQNNNNLNSHSNNRNIHIRSVPKVNIVDFNPYIHYFHNSVPSSIGKEEEEDNPDNYAVEYETPVLVENVLSEKVYDAICDSLVETIGDSAWVDMQRKVRDVDDDNNHRIRTEMYQVTMNEAFEYMMESQHDDSFFCFCEGLLEEHEYEKIDSEEDSTTSSHDGSLSLSQIRDILYHAKERLFSSNPKTTNGGDDEDLFPYFPVDVQPTDCIILAGEGATSTLHRDPFEWTGTSLCLEGTKVWRFIAPPIVMNHPPNNTTNPLNSVNSGVAHIDDVLQSYRLPSMAWGGENDDNDDKEQLPSLQLSAGWQSDYSLYAHRDNKKVLSARELAFLEDDERKQSTLEQIANDIQALSPNLPINEDNNNGGTLSYEIWTVIQKPGDLLIIPAHWWHQTYALEPSLAIASQRCGIHRDASRVIRHMLQTTSKYNNNDDMENSSSNKNNEDSNNNQPVNDPPLPNVPLLKDEKEVMKKLTQNKLPQEIVNELFHHLSLFQKKNHNIIQ